MKPGPREIAIGTVLALGCPSDLSESVDAEKARMAVRTRLEICRERIENLIGSLQIPTGMFRESSSEKVRMEREKCLREYNLPEDTSL